MAKVLKWLRLVLIVGPAILFAYFAWMVRYSNHPEKYSLELRYRRVRKLLFKILRHLRLSLTLEGVEKLNDGKQKIVVANHLGIFEPLMVIVLSQKPISFIAKKENRKKPFVGRIITAIDGVYIDRKDPLSTLREFRHLAKRMPETGCSYVIFPEGTRNRHSDSVDLLPTHAGSLKLATMTKLPILTLAHFGSERTLEGKSNWRSYPVQFSFMTMTPSIEDKDTVPFMGEVEKELIAKVREMRQIDKEYLEQGKNRHKADKWWRREGLCSILASE